MLREQQNVTSAFAQRRYRDADHVEAEVEILAKTPFRDLFLEVAAGRRHDARIETHLLALSEGTHGSLLEGAQELRLQLERHVADLVEKHGAAGSLEQESRSIPRSAREGAARMTEELALHEVTGDGAAAHRDERPRAVLRVENACDDLLAAAALAADEHGDVGTTDSAQTISQPLHRGALPDEVGVQRRQWNALA